MTDRYSALLVVLENDVRSDDAEETIIAIRRIKGVLRVEPWVTDWQVQAAKARALDEMERRLWRALRTDVP